MDVCEKLSAHIPSLHDPLWVSFIPPFAFWLFFEPQREFVSHASGEAFRISVLEHSGIRSDSLFSRMVFHTAEHPSFTRGSHDTMIWEMNPSEEINAGSEAFDENLVGMEREPEVAAEEHADLWNQFLKTCFILRENSKIIGIAQVAFQPQGLLHKLIEFIQVYVYEKLRSKISERQAYVWCGRGKTFYNFSEEGYYIAIWNGAFQNIKKCAMVNAREELADIAFQDPDSFCVVAARLARETSEAIQRFIRSFSHSAGIGVGDECLVEKWVEFPVKCVVQQAVTDNGLVNVAGLRIAYIERSVRPMVIYVRNKIAMQENYIVHKSERKFLHVGSLLFPFNEFHPCLKEVFRARYVFKSKRQFFHDDE